MTRRGGFVIAPVLYAISILGVLGSVFCTGYMQTVRSYSEVTAANSIRNELQLTAELVASRAVPQSGAQPTLDTPAASALPGTSDADYKRLPKTTAGMVITSVGLNPAGNANTAGLVPANIGAKQIDPWGRLILYCQWNGLQTPGTGASFLLLSAGADGRLETTCANIAAAAGSDDRVQYLTVANTMARARAWQAQPDNTYRFGVDASSSTAGRVVVGVSTAQDTDATQQLNVGGNGKFGGNLTVSGNLATTYVNAATVNASAVANSGDQSVGGKLTISGVISNPGASYNGGVAVNDVLYAYNDTGTGAAVKLAGTGVASQPEIGAYGSAANIPIRVSGQGTGAVILRTNNADQLTVSSNGNVGIGTSSPNVKLDINGGLQALAILNLSDRRLKENVLPLGAALAQVRRLRGVRFTWKADGTPSVGVIAQEVEAIYPELVQTGADGIKAVMYANLVAPLIEAVKALADRSDATGAATAELQAQVRQLQTDNAALAARLQRLEVAR